MPPKTALTNSFSSDLNEVVCPLKNTEGTPCRKRCSGDKKFRSIQEHIRRAHPDYYIAKLPATQESFEQMINTPPSAKPRPVQVPSASSQTYSSPVYGRDRDGFIPQSSTLTPRNLEDQYPAAATAAVALAQLHNARPDSDWGSEAGYGSETDSRRPMQQTIELPPIHTQYGATTTSQGLLDPRSRELLPSVMGHSPPERSTTLPPLERRESLQRKDRGNRPRKSSITQTSRRPRHEKGRSKDFSRRMSIEGRKAFSAEPPVLTAAAFKSKRWEDLIEAAASATEVDSDRDITPTPQSPPFSKRASLPPLHSSFTNPQSYKASPLGRALSPPAPSNLTGPPLFSAPNPNSNPSDPTNATRTNYTSGTTNPSYHISSSSDPASSPAYTRAQHMSNHSQSSSNSNGASEVHILCANCRRPNPLSQSYACTECISGFCVDCMWILNGDVRTGVRGRPCPRCGMTSARYKPVRLEIR